MILQWITIAITAQLHTAQEVHRFGDHLFPYGVFHPARQKVESRNFGPPQHNGNPDVGFLASSSHLRRLQSRGENQYLLEDEDKPIKPKAMNEKAFIYDHDEDPMPHPTSDPEYYGFPEEQPVKKWNKRITYHQEHNESNEEQRRKNTGGLGSPSKPLVWETFSGETRFGSSVEQNPNGPLNPVKYQAQAGNQDFKYQPKNKVNTKARPGVEKATLRKEDQGFVEPIDFSALFTEMNYRGRYSDDLSPRSSENVKQLSNSQPFSDTTKTPKQPKSITPSVVPTQSHPKRTSPKSLTDQTQEWSLTSNDNRETRSESVTSKFPVMSHAINPSELVVESSTDHSIRPLHPPEQASNEPRKVMYPVKHYHKLEKIQEMENKIKKKEQTLHLKDPKLLSSGASLVPKQNTVKTIKVARNDLSIPTSCKVELKQGDEEDEDDDNDGEEDEEDKRFKRAIDNKKEIEWMTCLICEDEHGGFTERCSLSPKPSLITQNLIEIEDAHDPGNLENAASGRVEVRTIPPITKRQGQYKEDPDYDPFLDEEDEEDEFDDDEDDDHEQNDKPAKTVSSTQTELPSHVVDSEPVSTYVPTSEEPITTYAPPVLTTSVPVVAAAESSLSALTSNSTRIRQPSVNPPPAMNRKRRIRTQVSKVKSAEENSSEVPASTSLPFSQPSNREPKRISAGNVEQQETSAKKTPCISKKPVAKQEETIEAVQPENVAELQPLVNLTETSAIEHKEELAQVEPDDPDSLKTSPVEIEEKNNVADEDHEHEEDVSDDEEEEEDDDEDEYDEYEEEPNEAESDQSEVDHDTTDMEANTEPSQDYNLVKYLNTENKTNTFDKKAADFNVDYMRQASQKNQKIKFPNGADVYTAIKQQFIAGQNTSHAAPDFSFSPEHPGFKQLREQKRKYGPGGLAVASNVEPVAIEPPYEQNKTHAEIKGNRDNPDESASEENYLSSKPDEETDDDTGEEDDDHDEEEDEDDQDDASSKVNDSLDDEDPYFTKQGFSFKDDWFDDEDFKDNEEEGSESVTARDEPKPEVSFYHTPLKIEHTYNPETNLETSDVVKNKKLEEDDEEPEELDHDDEEDPEDEQELASVVNDFVDENRSNCSRRTKGSMVCFYCVDDKGQEKENCLKAKASPNSHDVSFSITEETD